MYSLSPLGLHKLESDEVGILHRDISHNNILLGKDGAPEGERGVLVDLDLAFRATEVQPKITADYNIVSPVNTSSF